MPPKRKRTNAVEEDDDNQPVVVEQDTSVDKASSSTSHAQKLEQSHQSFAFTVAKMCEEYDKAPVTPEAVKTISYYTSLFLQQIVAKDLKAFAIHRTKQDSDSSEKVLIKSKDVLLLARRNESLKQQLHQFLEEYKENANAE